jgi:16S rRNA (adenine1518-N6/adenine1519-N6)-dimethyltransferase
MNLKNNKNIKNNNVKRAKKSLGQNFLKDKNIINRIISSLSDIENSFIIEIGPGKGAITKEFLKYHPYKYIVIEIDKNLLSILTEIKATYPGNIVIINDDALTVHEETLVERYNKDNKDIKIVSNLPYNISTVLLTKWLKKINLFTSLTLMFQKEVADRILAKPGSKTYGRLSVMTQWLCNIKKITNVPKSAFTPAPKITSTVLKIIPKKKYKKINFKIVEEVVKQAFSQRRKMIKSSLKNLIKDENERLKLLEKAGIKENLRPEQISVDQYLSLSKLFEKLSKSKPK